MPIYMEKHLLKIRKRLVAGIPLSKMNGVTILDVRNKKHIEILCRVGAYNGGLGLIWTVFNVNGKYIYVLIDENVKL